MLRCDSDCVRMYAVFEQAEAAAKRSNGACILRYDRNCYQAAKILHVDDFFFFFFAAAAYGRNVEFQTPNEALNAEK